MHVYCQLRNWSSLVSTFLKNLQDFQNHYALIVLCVILISWGNQLLSPREYLWAFYFQGFRGPVHSTNLICCFNFQSCRTCSTTVIQKLFFWKVCQYYWPSWHARHTFKDPKKVACSLLDIGGIWVWMTRYGTHQIKCSRLLDSFYTNSQPFNDFHDLKY